MRTIKYSQGDRVWITSDLHIGHDQEFVWKARGFESVEQMNETIISNLERMVAEDDDLWILGDLTLGDIEAAAAYLRRIPGHVHIVLGNHDTDRRIEFYESLGWDCHFAMRIKYGKQGIFLSHYPTSTSNPGEDYLSLATLNLYGHTHDTSCWHSENPFSFHVGMDSNDCEPWTICQIIQMIRHNLV